MSWRLKKEINKQKQKQLSEIAKHSSEIVKQLKTSINLMRRILQETEVKKVKKGRGPPKKKIDKQKLFQLRKEGKTINEIAKHLKVSPSLVQRRLKEGGVTKGKKGGRRPKKEIDKQKLSHLRKEGKTIPEIAKQLNVSVGFVHKRLKEGEVKE